MHLDELDQLLPVLVRQPVRRLDLPAVLDVREELLCARVHVWPPYLPIVRLRIIDVREARGADPHRRPPVRRAGLPGHVPGRPRRGARASRSRRSTTTSTRRKTCSGRSPGKAPRRSTRRSTPCRPTRRATERIRLALRAHLAVVAGQLDIATVFVREWRYLEGERRDALRRRAPPLRGADPRPLPRRRRAQRAAHRPRRRDRRRCSSSRPPTGPTRGCGPARRHRRARRPPRRALLDGMRGYASRR